MDALLSREVMRCVSDKAKVASSVLFSVSFSVNVPFTVASYPSVFKKKLHVSDRIVFISMLTNCSHLNSQMLFLYLIVRYFVKINNAICSKIWMQ